MTTRTAPAIRAIHEFLIWIAFATARAIFAANPVVLAIVGLVGLVVLGVALVAAPFAVGLLAAAWAWMTGIPAAIADLAT